MRRGGAGGGPGVMGQDGVWEANFKCHEGQSKWSEQGCGVYEQPSTSPTLADHHLCRRVAGHRHDIILPSYSHLFLRPHNRSTGNRMENASPLKTKEGLKE